MAGSGEHGRGDDEFVPVNDPNYTPMTFDAEEWLGDEVEWFGDEIVETIKQVDSNIKKLERNSDAETSKLFNLRGDVFSDDLIQKVEEVRRLVLDGLKRDEESRIVCGRHLASIKALLSNHKGGVWGKWLKASFSWSQTTADAWIDRAEAHDASFQPALKQAYEAKVAAREAKAAERKAKLEANAKKLAAAEKRDRDSRAKSFVERFGPQSNDWRDWQSFYLWLRGSSIEDLVAAGKAREAALGSAPAE